MATNLYGLSKKQIAIANIVSIEAPVILGNQTLSKPVALVWYKSQYLSSSPSHVWTITWLKHKIKVHPESLESCIIEIHAMY